MYTLKIAWTLHECAITPGAEAELLDEATLFIPADIVRVMARVDGPGAADGLVNGPGAADGLVNQWAQQNSVIFNYACVRRLVGGLTGETRVDPARLIEVERDGKSTWYLASRAWLLGPEGGTIERVAP